VVRAPLLVTKSALFVQATLDRSTTIWLQLDTGSPWGILDPMAAAQVGLAPGTHDVEIGGLDLGPRDFMGIALAGAGGPDPALPAGMVFRGTAGNGLFVGHSIGVNFRDSELWIAPTDTSTDTARLPRPDRVGPPSVSPIAQPLGYLIVPCAFDSEMIDHVCQLDTGSPQNVALESYWSGLPHPNMRRVPSAGVDYKGDILPAYYQRAQAARAGPSISIAEPAVLVFPRFDVITAVGQAIQMPLVGLIGNATSSRYHMVIDYGHQRIVFFPYRDPPPWDADDFTGYGFVVGLSTTALAVTVVPGSDAETKGVMTGDVLIGADGQVTFTDVGIPTGTVGVTRTFQFSRGAQSMLFDLVAEDLLPR
jgi:hypothetical protein